MDVRQTAVNETTVSSCDYILLRYVRLPPLLFCKHGLLPLLDGITYLPCRWSIVWFLFEAGVYEAINFRGALLRDLAVSETSAMRMLMCHNLPQNDSVAKDVCLNIAPICHCNMLPAALVATTYVMMNTERAQRSPLYAQYCLRTMQCNNIGWAAAVLHEHNSHVCICISTTLRLKQSVVEASCQYVVGI